MTKPTKKDGVTLLAEAIKQAGSDIGSLKGTKEAVQAHTELLTEQRQTLAEQHQVLQENNQLLKALQQQHTNPPASANGSLPPEIAIVARELDIAKQAVKKQLKFTGDWQHTLAQFLAKNDVLNGDKTTLPLPIFHGTAVRNGFSWGAIYLPEALQGKLCYVLVKVDNQWLFLQNEPLLLGNSIGLPEQINRPNINGGPTPPPVHLGWVDNVELLFLDPNLSSQSPVPTALNVEETVWID